jgi:hypothetical protein
MLKNKQYYLRRTHRYLGFFIGIQFLGWTISGLYFSWNDLDDVHGDHMRRVPRALAINASMVPPDMAIRELKSKMKVDSIHSVHLLGIVGKPVYQIQYFSGHAGDSHAHTHFALADPLTGSLRSPLTKQEATLLAKDHVVPAATVKEIKLLEDVDAHHEYRENVLPAYAVSFENPKCTVYISTERGTFQTIRHDQWRAFDFLWMFHTMDYQSRDDFNNWLLRTLSAFGLLTVLSGFILFFVSSRTLKAITK